MTATVPAEPSPEPFEHGLSKRGLWLLMSTIAAMTAFAPLATDIYLPALPNLTTDFSVTDSAAQLTLTATFLGIMVGQLVFGPLSDAVGRRRLVLATTMATVLATLGCVLAPSLGALTVARVALGVAGGAGIAIGRAIAADISRGPEAARFFSLLVTITMLAPLVGPLVGAALVTWTGSWRSTFVALMAFIALVALAIMAFVPETLPPDRRHGGGFTQLRQGATTLLRDRVFLGYAFTQVFGFAMLFTYIASSSFVFQDGFGLSPAEYAWTFGGIVLSVVFCGVLNRRLLLRTGARRLLVIALSVAVIASACLIPVLAPTTPSLLLTIVTLAFIVGTRAPVAANSMALGLERSRYAGTASAILGAMGFAGVLVAAPLLAVLPFTVGVNMAVAMVICAVCALLSTVALSRRVSTHE